MNELLSPWLFSCEFFSSTISSTLEDWILRIETGKGLIYHCSSLMFKRKLSQFVLAGISYDVTNIVIRLDSVQMSIETMVVIYWRTFPNQAPQPSNSCQRKQIGARQPSQAFACFLEYQHFNQLEIRLTFSIQDLDENDHKATNTCSVAKHSTVEYILSQHQCKCIL